ncbi:MAG: DUF2971 domain-containing protein [Nitrososphaerales archaeon]
MKTLFHYCSTASFRAIIETKTLWFSSLSLSNDSSEGRLVAETIDRLAKKDSLDEFDLARVQRVINLYEQILDGLGFCMSENGDLLSQWRGYAADGTGVSIGFSSEYLNWLAEQAVNGCRFGLRQVIYDPVTHEGIVKASYEEAVRYVRSEEGNSIFKVTGTVDAKTRKMNAEDMLRKIASEHVPKMVEFTEQAHSRLFKMMLPLCTKLFNLKSCDFYEEREWRLLSFFQRDGEDECDHRASHDRIIPYREFNLAELNRRPITEVILGPGHSTPPNVIQNFLKLNDFGDVPVKRSVISYRPK